MRREGGAHSIVEIWSSEVDRHAVPSELLSIQNRTVADLLGRLKAAVRHASRLSDEAGRKGRCREQLPEWPVGNREHCRHDDAGSSVVCLRIKSRSAFSQKFIFRESTARRCCASRSTSFETPSHAARRPSNGCALRKRSKISEH